MSDDFSFEDLAPAHWLNDISGFTDKHLPTLSEVSKEHWLDLEPSQEDDQDDGQNPKTSKQTRERNKCNAKNYRDRKRSHLDLMKKQLELLHHENAILKSQKVCRSCKRPFSPAVLTATTSQYPPYYKDHRNCDFLCKDMENEFQNPNLQKGVRRQKNPKIWIALGILLLVLGLTMHGIDGDCQYIRRIELNKQHVLKWQRQLEEKDKSEYFQVGMKLEESSADAQKEGKEGLRIHFRSPSQVASQQQEEENISISKGLLLSIQTEMDDIGTYL